MPIDENSRSGADLYGHREYLKLRLLAAIKRFAKITFEDVRQIFEAVQGVAEIPPLSTIYLRYLYRLVHQLKFCLKISTSY